MKKLFILPLALLLITACQNTSLPTEPSSAPETLAPAAEETSAEALKNKIVLDAPQMNEQVHSPLRVTGQARGTWFFEGSFPVMLLDDSGNMLVQAPATSAEPWMTEEFIPFQVTLNFETEATHGELILQKDNPSGLADLDEELRLPVRF